MKRTAIIAVVAVLLLGTDKPHSAGAALYGAIPSGSDTQLVTVDPLTGAATAVGPVGLPDVRGLAGRASDMI